MAKMSGKTFAFFPTPYPDETLYSVLCRFYIRLGRPAYKQLSEELLGRRFSLNTYIPQGIGWLASHMPRETGITAEYLIYQTTMFPYFAPFLIQERKNTYLEYMLRTDIHPENTFFSLGTGKLRQPKSMYLRLCKSCWREDAQALGEPFWHRTHQLPGVLMCHRHGEPLMDAPILVSQANNDFFAASIDMIERGSICGVFRDNMAEKLMLLSKNSQWLLENGHKLGSYEQIFPKYDLWLRNSGYSFWNGRIWHTKIFHAINSLYGEEFLRLVNAYDENTTVTWQKYILSNRRRTSTQLPMFHILLHILLTETTVEFFNGDCQKPLPYGKGPWPCRNPVCPYNLEDVIKTIDMRYDRGFYRAFFQCPHCGFSYRRKHPITKEKQYAGRVYIASYGHLWLQKLREYIVDQGLSARRTCEHLQCDMYTVQKYAVQLGYMKPEDATPYVKKYQPKPAQPEKHVLTESEERSTRRQTWEQLVADNPHANRSLLYTLAPSVYSWLWRNDPSWFQEHLPKAQYSTHFDWDACDIECLERVQKAVDSLVNMAGKPIWISINRIARQSGLNRIRNNTTLRRMPKTAAYLSENIEPIDDWRKRKIIWAIRVLRERGDNITLFKIGFTASIGNNSALELYDFMLECMAQVEQSQKTVY